MKIQLLEELFHYHPFQCQGSESEVELEFSVKLAGLLSVGLERLFEKGHNR